MAELTIELGNENDFPPEDLDRLEAELRALDGSLTLSRTARHLVGRGVTWWELAYVWLSDQVGAAVVGSFVTVIIQWTRGRFKKGNRRPKYVEIYGPDGNLLKAVLIKSRRAKLEDHTEEVRARPPRTHPRDRDKAKE
jgi:hypothetical protein